ncbi:hypothetical protein [Methylobacterium oxalidis]|uniref:Uncharacterized protein n=1 Tax=Methylobacterium oxalidis TaxID=944322 RepID=A0A512J8E0_9HYPH|nr:hypothetical protein [Methylobacterium oxalidis]GEP06183.1 hypothetical protein MOX02_42210 [Methylobacterium oxalidis]GJE33843.1 hypothetical protein LDDCCGHA_4046 [Methylobacterium oxalidis]GLS62963.1 hypothetical protein GCM10007888_13440 [Methylobacterium oxalidis]
MTDNDRAFLAEIKNKTSRPNRNDVKRLREILSRMRWDQIFEVKAPRGQAALRAS